MRILYIFPHPDDESFGPGPGMAAQRRAGHEVVLLTLTKGGATKKRHDLGLSVEEMGNIRYAEMLDVAETLDLTEMTVLDLPDSGLPEMDPREIEDVVREHIARIRPEIIVTYPVHGISGFFDHLVTHAVVKRVYLEMLEGEGADYLKRLAFYTIPEGVGEDSIHNLTGSKADKIDCIHAVTDADVQLGIDALDCYVTYKSTIEDTHVKDTLGPVHYELYNESHDPPLDDLTLFDG